MEFVELENIQLHVILKYFSEETLSIKKNSRILVVLQFPTHNFIINE